MSQPSRPSREEILGAFSVEPRPDRKTLERYLRAYPEYTEELIDLSREVGRDLRQYDAPLSQKDRAYIDEAWRRHSAIGRASISDPFAAMSVADLREVARGLGVPRQVVTAFRECRVILATVPRAFLARLAEAVNISTSKLEGFLSMPQPAPVQARSYKADSKPVAFEPVSFERLLIDAGIPEDKRAELMADKG